MKTSKKSNILRAIFETEAYLTLALKVRHLIAHP